MSDYKQNEITEIELNGCDDFHIHLRNEDSLPLLVEHCSIQIERGLIMPNTKPPILTVSDAQNYYNTIKKYAANYKQSFEPLMSLYLTDSTPISEIELASKSSIVYAFKLYPKNATTNSKFGVTNIKSENMKKIFGAMEKYGLILCVHGEVNINDKTNKFIDIFEREHAFIDNELNYLLSEFPNLRIILEHVTTKKSVDFILNYYSKRDESKINLAATITAHHLLSNRNDIFKNNRINPHYFCLPILKTEQDQTALINAAISGKPYFFGGSDSAPHTQKTKENSCGCAGIYTMYNIIPLYAETFSNYNSMDKLNNFLTKFGADFYGIKQNENKVKLIKEKNKVPDSFKYIKGDNLIPYKAGQELNWILKRQKDFKYTAESNNNYKQDTNLLQMIDKCMNFVNDSI